MNNLLCVNCLCVSDEWPQPELFLKQKYVAMNYKLSKSLFVGIVGRILCEQGSERPPFCGFRRRTLVENGRVKESLRLLYGAQTCNASTFKSNMQFYASALLLAAHSVQGAVDPDSIKYISSYEPSALQSGQDTYGSTFASSAAYSEADNAVMFTGTTWGRFFESPEQMRDEDYDQYGNEISDPKIVSGCFLGAVALPGRDRKQQQYYDPTAPQQNGMFWTRRQRIKAPSANEACNAMHYASQTKHALVAGHSESNESVKFTKDVIAQETQQYGLVMDLRYNVEGDKAFHVVGGKQMKDDSVIYPVALDTPKETEHEGLYVLYMEANRRPASHVDMTENDHPHDPAAYFSYDAGYGMALAKYKINSQHPTKRSSVERIEQEWFEVFKTIESQQSKVFVGDVIALESGVVIAAGSTDGSGEAFGVGDVHSGMDGFITKFDVRGVTTKNFEESTIGKSSAVLRISSQKRKNDYITNLCYSKDDALVIYAVGYTQGKLPDVDNKVVGHISAFVMKIEVSSMTTLWTRAIGGRKRMDVVKGMACAVGVDGIWFGGTAEDGALVAGVELQKPFGGKDIFFAKLSSEDGRVIFTKQMGTDQDDEMVIRGGIVTDSGGNAVIIGNTYGSFYRGRSTEEKQSDVFVFTVSSFDGSVAPTYETKKTSRRFANMLGLLLVFIGAWFVLFPFVARKSKMDSGATERSKVTSYLSKFDIEDVDLRHSATGGWHCNFVGPLAEGRMRKRPFSYHTAEETIIYISKTDDDTLDASGRSLLRSNDEDNSSHSSFGDLMNTYSESYDSRLNREKESLWGKEII